MSKFDIELTDAASGKKILVGIFSIASVEPVDGACEIVVDPWQSGIDEPTRRIRVREDTAKVTSMQQDAMRRIFS